MPYVTTLDGTEIYYKDWGAGRPVVLSHGWPLNADSWESQQHHLAQNGNRAIAHDRRGHGRSSQTWSGNEMDTYADDLAELIRHLDLQELTLVACGRACARHPRRRRSGGAVRGRRQGLRRTDRRWPEPRAPANLTPGHQETWVNYRRDNRAPLLFIAGGADHIMPPAVNKSNAKKYRRSEAVTEYHEFAGRSHWTCGEPGWEKVADHALRWAEEHSTRGPFPA